MAWMMWLRGFSIRSRLLACMALVVGIGFVVGGVMSWQLARLQSQFDEFTNQEFAATQVMARLSMSLSQLRSQEKAVMIAAGDSVSAEAGQKQWQRQLVDTRGQLQTLEQVAPTQAIRQKIKSLAAQVDAYDKELAPTLGLIANSALSSVADAYQSSAPAREIGDAVEAGTLQVAQDIKQVAQARRDQVNSTTRLSTVMLWALLLSPGLIFLPLMGLTIVSITRPLAQAERIADAIAQGDLTRHVATQGQDEMAHLMRSMAHMQDGLRAMVSAVRESSESMLTASTEIAAGNQDLSSRTEQTAANLQDAASAMDELSKTVEHSAESAKVANLLADTASQRASQGGEVVHSVVSQMDQITQASRRIGDIIGTIDGIAFQTNILALNAAVEAARAGEQGRGFAVVAAEVRSLAQRSAEAAREIKGLIGQSVDRVEVGSHKVREAGEVMAEIVGSIGRVTQAMGEIADATQQQSQGIGNVTESVSQLDQMTQQNAALVEQSAAAAASLRQQAMALSQSVQRFKTAA